MNYPRISGVFIANEDFEALPISGGRHMGQPYTIGSALADFEGKQKWEVVLCFFDEHNPDMAELSRFIRRGTRLVISGYMKPDKVRLLLMVESWGVQMSRQERDSYEYLKTLGSAGGAEEEDDGIDIDV